MKKATKLYNLKESEYLTLMEKSVLYLDSGDLHKIDHKYATYKSNNGEMEIVMINSVPEDSRFYQEFTTHMLENYDIRMINLAYKIIDINGNLITKDELFKKYYFNPLFVDMDDIIYIFVKDGYNRWEYRYEEV